MPTLSNGWTLAILFFIFCVVPVLFKVVFYVLNLFFIFYCIYPILQFKMRHSWEHQLLQATDNTTWLTIVIIEGESRSQPQLPPPLLSSWHITALYVGITLSTKVCELLQNDIVFTSVEGNFIGNWIGTSPITQSQNTCCSGNKCPIMSVSMASSVYHRILTCRLIGKQQLKITSSMFIFELYEIIFLYVGILFHYTTHIFHQFSLY